MISAQLVDVREDGSIEVEYVNNKNNLTVRRNIQFPDAATLANVVKLEEYLMRACPLGRLRDPEEVEDVKKPIRDAFIALGVATFTIPEARDVQQAQGRI